MATYNIATTTVDVAALNVGDILYCPYTGQPVSLALPPGKYAIEARGAAGGGNTSSRTDIGSRGGFGGITNATLVNDTYRTVYIYVGQLGPTVNSWTSGGWNGGGGASFSSGPLGCGGGATDIRLIGGAWNNTEGLKSRIIVAGGGGGSDDTSTASGTYHARRYDKRSSPPENDNDESGGWGGGLEGCGALTNGYEANYGYGTQTKGGTAGSNGVSGGFGYGGGSTHSNDWGGGGGGWYGGASGGGSFQGGGGGSSYVSGYPGCDTTYIAYQGSVSFTDVTITQGGHSGNGELYITIVEVGSGYIFSRNETVKWVKSITTLTPPTKTTYTAGEYFDISGMSVRLTKTDDTTEDVLASSLLYSHSNYPLTAGDTEILLRFYYKGKRYNVRQAITVS